MWYLADQVSTGDGSAKVLIAVIIIIALWGGSWGPKDKGKK